MSFINPVSKVMQKASIRERTAAYVDNIGEYLDNSLHYAEFIRVYNGGFCDGSGDALATDIADAEKKAVDEIVSTCLDGAVDDKGDYIKGKVRVLKLINEPTGGYEQGQIYESVWEFTAGEYGEYPKRNPPEPIVNTINEYTAPSLITTDKKVVNDEHLEEYGYYYNTGFFTFDNLDNPDAYTDISGAGKSYAPTSKLYYSRLYPIMYDSTNDGVLNEELQMNTNSGSMYNLCINVVAFQKGNMEYAEHEKDDGSTEKIPVFQSPAQLTSTSMSLINVIDAEQSDNPVYVRFDRNNDTGVVREVGGKKQFVNELHAGNPYSVYNSNDNDGNVYVVFIMPDEINDTNIIYK